MFYDPQRFRFTAPLEAAWRTIRAELDALEPTRFEPWVEQDLYRGENWQVFLLYTDPSIVEFDAVARRNRAACPATCAVLEQLPGLLKAGFSKMLPRAHVAPHAGSLHHLVRCHLGLRVPSTGTRLRFGDDARPWAEGACLVFEDTAWHEAFNDSDEERVVLLADFAKAVVAPDLETTG